MKNLLYIGNELSNKGKNTTSIETLGRLLESEGFIVKTASKKSNKLLRLVDMLSAVLKHQKKTDFVLIDTYSTYNFYYALFVSQLCRLLKLKYVPILRGGNLPSRLRSHSKLSGIIFNNAHKNVAPSEYMKSSFESSGYSNVICIPNSIEIKNYPFKMRSYDPCKLLWVRSFSEIYNPMLAVKLLKLLKEESLQVSLCMVGPDGDGSLAKVKNFAREMGLEVQFTGKLSKQEWVSLSEEYSIFINTTNFDNMPVSVIEAMALGLPVISTNVGGMPYLIKHKQDGLLTEPDNPGAFLKTIKSIVENPEITNDMVLRAREKVELYNWQVVKEQWKALFQ